MLLITSVLREPNSYSRTLGPEFRLAVSGNSVVGTSTTSAKILPKHTCQVIDKNEFA